MLIFNKTISLRTFWQNFSYLSFQNLILFFIVIFLFSSGTLKAQNNNNNYKSTEIKAHSKFLGTASCSSSNCHGHAAPVKGASVRLNEYLTWLKHDQHSSAYKTLLNEQSRRIALNLGIPAAEKDPTCLSCHATYVEDKENQGQKFRIEDGVSCESCHGAAEKWISSHAQTNSDYRQNVSNGLKDLKNVQIKTKVCLSCHLGNEDQFITHKIMGAGHPRINFEQDTFESVMPRHWDYKDYKYAENWLISQTVQAVERTKALYSEKRSKDGMFPEFTTMTCYSCHHDLNDRQYQEKTYSGRPGMVHLNTSELWILKQALQVKNPQLANELSGHIEKLISLFGKEDISEISRQTVAFLNDKVLPSVSNSSLSKENQVAIFKALTSSQHSNLQYETAEQIAMAAALIATLNPEEAALKTKTMELYKALQRPGKVDLIPFRN